MTTSFTMIRRYSELRRFDTFRERFEYLRLNGHVGESTFGFDRWINQRFYSSWEWKNVRNQVIIRDNGCDLGIPGYEINGSLLIHHINPREVDDVSHGEEWSLIPEYLITTTQTTHNAIHYGERSTVPRQMVVRRPGDTKLW